MPNKQIKAVIKEFDNHLEGICFVDDGKYSQDDDGINYDITEEMNELKAFLKSKLQETYEAGQKSREKEIEKAYKNGKQEELETNIELIKSWHEKTDCNPTVKELVDLLENKNMEFWQKQLKSLSLTKESK